MCVLCAYVYAHVYVLSTSLYISSSDQSIPSLNDILDDESLEHHKQFVEQVEKQVTKDD